MMPVYTCVYVVQYSNTCRMIPQIALLHVANIMSLMYNANMAVPCCKKVFQTTVMLACVSGVFVARHPLLSRLAGQHMQSHFIHPTLHSTEVAWSHAFLLHKLADILYACSLIPIAGAAHAAPARGLGPVPAVGVCPCGRLRGQQGEPAPAAGDAGCRHHPQEHSSRSEPVAWDCVSCVAGALKRR